MIFAAHFLSNSEGRTHTEDGTTIIERGALQRLLVLVKTELSSRIMLFFSSST